LTDQYVGSHKQSESTGHSVAGKFN